MQGNGCIAEKKLGAIIVNTLLLDRWPVFHSLYKGDVKYLTFIYRMNGTQEVKFIYSYFDLE